MKRLWAAFPLLVAFAFAAPALPTISEAEAIERLSQAERLVVVAHPNPPDRLVEVLRSLLSQGLEVEAFLPSSACAELEPLGARCVQQLPGRFLLWDGLAGYVYEPAAGGYLLLPKEVAKIFFQRLKEALQ